MGIFSNSPGLSENSTWAIWELITEGFLDGKGCLGILSDSLGLSENSTWENWELITEG